MHIAFAHFDNLANTSGVTSWLMRIIVEIRSRGFDLSCLVYSYTPTEVGTFERFCCENGVPVARTGFQNDTATNVAWTVAQLRESRPDVFVPSSIVPAWYASAQLQADGIPCIGVCHSDDRFYHALIDQCVAANGWHQMAGCISVSSYLHDSVKSKATSRTLCKYIPYGVDAHEGRSISSGADPKLKLAYVGRFAEEQKRISRTAEFICHAANANENVDATFYGNGDDSLIEEVISRFNCGSQVRIGGWLAPESVVETLVGYDVLVLLSDYEGLPVSLLEAMSVGVVPVCTKQRSGVGQLIRNGENGFLIDPVLEEFKKTIDLLASNRDRLRLCSVAAARTIQQEYSIQSCAGEWIDFVQTLVESWTRANPVSSSLPPAHADLQQFDRRLPPVYVPWTRRMNLKARRIAKRILKSFIGTSH